MITELEFKSLASQGYNRIPLMTEAFADLETPLSLYLKLACAQGGGRHSFLLESVVGGERFGRYSFIGLPARTVVRASGFGDAARTEVVTDGQVVEQLPGNPLDAIDAYQKRFKVALLPGLPRFCGGLAGYFGYDTVRHIEKKLQASCPPDPLGLPDILLMHTEEVAVIDNLAGRLYLIVYADPAAPEAGFVLNCRYFPVFSRFFGRQVERDSLPSSRTTAPPLASSTGSTAGSVATQLNSRGESSFWPSRSSVRTRYS